MPARPLVSGVVSAPVPLHSGSPGASLRGGSAWAVALALATAGSALAGSTGTAALHTPQGSGAPGPGDYITHASGLDTFYRYFIEVPPGLSRLVVEIFDPDVGAGGVAEADDQRDRRRGSAFDTAVEYQLRRPDGSLAASLACDAIACLDDGWQALLDSTDSADLAAGHWELQVDMSDSATTGDDINAFGVRAHDGDPGSGGAELNVYYDSHVGLGVNPPPSGVAARSYDLYPYLTSGCSAGKNDFDWDSNSGATGGVVLESRSGSFTQSYGTASMSSNLEWRRDLFTGWTADQRAGDYGVWHAVVEIASYFTGVQNGNYGHLYLSSFQAGANPPTANPTAGALRVYLASDVGAAPVKPYLEQALVHLSGPNPPQAGQTSRFRVRVTVFNPTQSHVVFSTPNNLVVANLPGGGTVYAGNADLLMGSGTVVSEPSVGGTGVLSWNPGTVPAGDLTSLTYEVNVTPTSAGQRIPVTATPGSGSGTRARYIDETGNGTQTRATQLLGPLCELAVTEGLLAPAAATLAFLSPASTAGEAAGTAMIDLVLTTGDGFPLRQGVSVAVAAVDGSAISPGDYGLAPGLLSFGIFSPSGELRTIGVSVVGDALDEADEDLAVQLSNPTGAVLGTATHSLTILDDDTAGVSVAPTSGLVTSEAGGADTFEVVLDSEPFGDVVIGVASLDPGEGTASPSEIEFAPADWHLPRSVTLTGVDDLVNDGDQAYAVELRVDGAGTADAAYAAIDPPDVAAVNRDDPFEGTYFTLLPCRLLDTREPGQGPALLDGAPRTLAAHGRCGVPATARALAVNLTVVAATADGFLIVYAGDASPPATSDLSFAAGQTRANNALVALASDGSGTLSLLPTLAGAGAVHVIVDVVGYFE
jgi:hypothetical protein